MLNIGDISKLTSIDNEITDGDLNIEDPLNELRGDLKDPLKKRDTLIKGIVLSELFKSPREKY